MIKKIITKFKLYYLQYFFYRGLNRYYNNSGIKMDISTVENFIRAKNLKTKEPATVEWIESFEKDSVFYDIGANVGVFSLYAANRVKNILAFEPHFMNYDILNKNIYINQFSNVKAYCLAFSDKTEVGSFEHLKFSAGSSTSQFNRTIDDKGKTFTSKFSQGMISLPIDKFVALSGEEYFPNYIKIDVDGLEEKIIEGMKGIVNDSRLQSVLIEITDISAQKESVNTIRDFFLERGFNLKLKEATSSTAANYIFIR